MSDEGQMVNPTNNAFLSFLQLLEYVRDTESEGAQPQRFGIWMFPPPPCHNSKLIYSIKFKHPPILNNLCNNPLPHPTGIILYMDDIT